MVATELPTANTTTRSSSSKLPPSEKDASFEKPIDSPVVLVEEVKGRGTVEVEMEVDVEDCPDGGLKAWLVVVGAVCGMCATIGLINAWGTFQAYYQQVELRQQSSSDIAWIGSIQNAMRYTAGLLTGRLFDMGHLRLPVFIASALFVACMFLTAECTQYWQFLLCQGFGIGLTSGVFFTMTNMVMTHWFKKRLGLAYAFMYAGAGIGGCIFPVIFKALLQRMSFPWTMRILAFITLGLLAVTNLTITRRLPPKQDRSPLINLAEFKNPTYSLYVLSLFINALALFTALTYLTISAAKAGIDANMSFALLSIANAASTLGRIAAGLLADLYGPLTVLMSAALMSAVMTYAWPFAKDVAGFAVIAALVGMSTGAIIATLVYPFTRMGPVSDVGVRIGMGLTVMSIGILAGPPISGAIVDATGSFRNVGYYAGSMLALSAVFMFVVRHLTIRMGTGSRIIA
ncbi:MFS general substrate transporter [Ganoderma leucocontextum]|nr:MFS general substrate transporter [Ganoderma leucocontextum]